MTLIISLLATLLALSPASLDTEAKAGLQGSWTVSTLNGSPWQAASSTSIKIDVVAAVFSGYDGCNSFGGSLAKYDNEHVKFTDISSTEKHCENVPHNEFQSALMDVRSYQISPVGVDLLNKDGDILIGLEHVGE